MRRWGRAERASTEAKGTEALAGPTMLAASEETVEETTALTGEADAPIEEREPVDVVTEVLARTGVDPVGLVDRRGWMARWKDQVRLVEATLATDRDAGRTLTETVEAMIES